MMNLSFQPFAGRQRRIAGGLLFLGVATASGAWAATNHRFIVTQAAGSLGATAFVQSSSSSSALQGEVAGSANTNLKIPFGVLGDYDPASGAQFGIGVVGVSTTGYAVGAESFGVNPAILGESQGSADGLEVFAENTSEFGYGIYSNALGHGDGIDAYGSKEGWGGYFVSQAGTGVEGISNGSATTDYAVYGSSVSGDAGHFVSSAGEGVYATSQDSGHVAGVFDAPDAGGDSRAVLGDYTGEAIVGFGRSGNAHGAVTAISSVAGTDIFTGESYNSGTPHRSFIVQAGTADNSNLAASYGSDVQMSGDLYVFGQVFQNCGAFPETVATGCDAVPTAAVRSSGGSNVAMYGSHETLPTVEDEGTAQLVNGRAYVRLDAKFAQTMSPSQAYRVFVTPNGPSRGVYVTNRSPQGFEVDENPGGRSTVSFDYRIVAQQFGVRATRLADVQRKAAAKPDAQPGDAALRAQMTADYGHLAADRARQAAKRRLEAAHKIPASFAQVRGHAL